MPPMRPPRGAMKKAKDPKKTLFRLLSYLKKYIPTLLIVILDNGMVCDVGTHDELLARCPIYQEVYYSQEKGREE